MGQSVVIDQRLLDFMNISEQLSFVFIPVER